MTRQMFQRVAGQRPSADVSGGGARNSWVLALLSLPGNSPPPNPEGSIPPLLTVARPRRNAEDSIEVDFDHIPILHSYMPLRRREGIATMVRGDAVLASRQTLHTPGSTQAAGGLHTALSFDHHQGSIVAG